MTTRKSKPASQKLSRAHKIAALMNYFGISRAEAIAMLADMGE